MKRVVATQFQTITSKGNEVLIKNPGSESWRVLPERYFPDNGRNTPTRPGHHAVQGADATTSSSWATTASISCDSRIWEPVPGSDIVGRVVAVVWRSWHPDLIIF